MAREFYPNARIGDKLNVVALYPYPYVPYFPIRCADPYADAWLSLFIADQHQVHPQHKLNPVLCDQAVLDIIRDEYIVYRWPEQMSVICQDVVCPTCGMVDSVDGFELSFGVDPCNPELCMIPT